VAVQQGDVFADRYLVEQTLGSGGMGVVYRVLDQRLHRQAALKIMNPDLSHDPTFRERFEREAKAGARFEHPNVVNVHHYDEHDGVLYLVMQYIEGHNLRRELDLTGRFAVGRAADVATQVAAGLDAAHRNGHVHRDVKPANILLGRNPDGSDRVLLTDFGLAQPLASVSDDRLTSAGTMLGTAAYSAPEQFRGEPATVRSDVYSLACVSFEMLAGRPPFGGATEVETAGGHLTQTAPELTAVIPGVPPRVSQVVARGLAKSAADRPSSAGSFAEDLSRAAASTTEATQVMDLPPTPLPVAAPQTAPVPTRPPRVPAAAAAPAAAPRRNRVLLIAAAVVVAAFGVGLAGGLLNGPDDGNGGTSPTPSTSGAADPHTALAASLPSSVYTSCKPQPEREGGGRVTSLTCAPAVAGVDELLVSVWSSADAMAADFTKNDKVKPDGKCGSYTGLPATGLRSTWGNGQPLACYLNSNGAAVVMWEYPSKALQVLAVRKDGNAQATFQWWTSAIKTPLP
jgi:serine/threonine protein kinase